MKRETKNIQNLNIDYLGITLNEQDIDLMMIANKKKSKRITRSFKNNNKY